MRNAIIDYIMNWLYGLKKTETTKFCPQITIYEKGTSNLKETYTGPDGDIMNTNPIILDEKGNAEIWI